MKRWLLAGVVSLLVVATVSSVQAVGCEASEGTSLTDGCLYTITGGDTPDPTDGFPVTMKSDPAAARRPPTISRPEGPREPRMGRRATGEEEAANLALPPDESGRRCHRATHTSPQRRGSP